MRAYFLICVLGLAACGGSSTGFGPGIDAHGSTDSASTSPGFELNIGQPYSSSAAVHIRPVRDNGVYSGYFQAESDQSTEPNLSVSILMASPELSAGMSVPCARSATENTFAETSVLVKWLDGDTYYTNVMSTTSCTVHITAASQTSISAEISGTIYDETNGLTPTTFTASFVAAATE